VNALLDATEVLLWGSLAASAALAAVAIVFVALLRRDSRRALPTAAVLLDEEALQSFRTRVLDRFRSEPDFREPPTVRIPPGVSFRTAAPSAEYAERMRLVASELAMWLADMGMASFDPVVTRDTTADKSAGSKPLQVQYRPRPGPFEGFRDESHGRKGPFERDTTQRQVVVFISEDAHGEHAVYFTYDLHANTVTVLNADILGGILPHPYPKRFKPSTWTRP
jgi:hypothetical protein